MVKVLIADDEVEILAATAALLELSGFEVVTEREAGRIMARLHEESPDVLLQDVRMPDFDLDRHMQAIRDDPRLQDLTVVIFSAYVDAHEIARRLGAAGAVAKPFEPEHLVQTLLEAHAGARAAARESERARTRPTDLVDAGAAVSGSMAGR